MSIVCGADVVKVVLSAPESWQSSSYRSAGEWMPKSPSTRKVWLNPRSPKQRSPAVDGVGSPDNQLVWQISSVIFGESCRKALSVRLGSECSGLAAWRRNGRRSRTRRTFPPHPSPRSRSGYPGNVLSKHRARIDRECRAVRDHPLLRFARAMPVVFCGNGVARALEFSIQDRVEAP